MRAKEDGKQHEVKVQFLWYGTTNKRDKSGAYLFLPDGQGQVSACCDRNGREGEGGERREGGEGELRTKISMPHMSH